MSPDLYVGLPIELIVADPAQAPDVLQSAAAHIETIGATGCFVTDHPAPDRRWLEAGGHFAMEPTVALSFAAAATSSLRLLTNIYVLGYRNPFLAAGSLGGLDVLSGGRLTVGVGAGYLRPEFGALGVDFERRNELLDEALRTIAAVWRDDEVAAAGIGWRSRGTMIRPQPLSPPPIWSGGNSRAAIRRAVDLADGWMPFATAPGLSGAVKTGSINSLDELAGRLRYLDEYCEESKRSQRPHLCFAPRSTNLDDLTTEVAGAVDLGIDSVTLTPSGATLAEWSDDAEHKVAATRSS